MRELFRPEKNKIGVLTFHRAVNYGAVLQAYALKRVLSSHGCAARVIDYRNALIDKAYGTFYLGAAVSLRSVVAAVANFPVKVIKNCKFRRFCRRFLDLDARGKDSAGLRRINSEYDAFVTGSDQVWSHGRSGFDKAYFLDFADVKKYSYAASFGFSELGEEYKSAYGQLLRGYERISVREKQGAEIVGHLLGKPAEVVLDPTLLLDKRGWLEIASRSKILKRVPKRYILLYVFGLTPSLKEFVCRLSEEKGLCIVWIQASMSQMLPRTRRLFTASPEDFVALAANAEYIVTNSFHGTAFAINFEKEFFTELLPEHYGLNSRVEHILGALGLSGRLIGGEIKPADYAFAAAELARQREKSLQFISDIASLRVGEYAL